jgi:hypothetical protein
MEKVNLTDINWNLHPTIDEWRQVLTEAGFCDLRVEAYLPFRLRRFVPEGLSWLVQLVYKPVYFLRSKWLG